MSWVDDLLVASLRNAERKFGPMAIAPNDDLVNHPSHYGGEGNPYEVIKVIEAWGLGFALGNTVKYIYRAGRKDSGVVDLKKARWYLDREIGRLEADV